MKELLLEKRRCECCDGDDLELVYSNKSRLRARSEIYLFWQHVVVCRRCGFCFNSPCPTREDLESYYTNIFSINEATPFHYSIDARINALKKHISKETNFVEIGGNQSGEFHKKLLKYVGSIQNIDLNDECPSNLKTINILPEASVDILACYDVLEHIPKIKEFLQSCSRVLKEGGIMMIEVPDIKFYPRNLMLFCAEHVNHFSAHTLEKIANNSGFELIEIEHAASSRPLTGFLAVFKKENKKEKNCNFDESRAEYLDALACVKDGNEQVERLQNHINQLRKRIIKLNEGGKKVTLWCVTDFFYKMIDDFELPRNTIVVDSDIRKKDHLKDKKILIRQPAACLKHIKESDLLIIFSSRNKKNILEWIKSNGGKAFSAEKLEIVGDGLYG